MTEKIKDLFFDFIKDAEKAKKGTKAAGVRARKTSFALEKALKEFRKESVKWA